MADGAVKPASGWPFFASRCIALLVVIFHVAAIPAEYALQDIIPVNRTIIVLAGLVAVLCLDNHNSELLGFRLWPAQGWGFWFRMGIYFGAAIGLLLAVLLILAWLMGLTVPIEARAPSVRALLSMCLNAPLEEELVYRALLIFAIAPTCGDLGSIFISGIVFAAIHVLGGNPGPDNQVAGFMLAWAFIKSRTILVPMALHSAGNLIAFANFTAGWWYLHAA
jgi:membrane protease YdiL (CAAX protease family)